MLFLLQSGKSKEARMPNHLAAQSESCDPETLSVWSHVPDNLLLMIFSYLEPADLLTASEVSTKMF